MRQVQIAKQLALGVALAGIWSPQVWAQAETPAADEASDGNEIIVTARRVEETLQDVPLMLKARPSSSIWLATPTSVCSRPAHVTT